MNSSCKYGPNQTKQSDKHIFSLIIECEVWNELDNQKEKKRSGGRSTDNSSSTNSFRNTSKLSIQESHDSGHGQKFNWLQSLKVVTNTSSHTHLSNDWSGQLKFFLLPFIHLRFGKGRTESKTVPTSFSTTLWHDCLLCTRIYK